MKANFTHLCLTLAALLYSCSGILAQTQPIKFGKVDRSELEMRQYEKDTSAAAVVLSDVGYSHFTYARDGFQVVFERHTRIKILKKSGYEHADVAIPFYQQSSRKEAITNIKGFTYNLENGKETKDKLDNKAEFEEQMSENWYAKKFTMPNVKEGSVIEYSYTIVSDFLYNLREWEFQTTIPVVYSEYKVRVPEYFDYKQHQQGYLSFSESKEEKGRESFTVTWSAEVTPGLGGGRTPGGSERVEAQNTTYLWVVKDAPALREERYITTIRDYQSKIEFELLRTKFPGEPYRVATGNWNDVTLDLMKSDRFGTQLNRKGFFKNEVASIQAKYKDSSEQMAAVYNLVQSKVKWNGGYGIYSTGPLRKAYESGTGSAADINLLLVAMLQEAGVDAAPVLLSTRSHGRVFTGYSPMLNKFNYVVAHVQIGDKEYLLDGTDPFLVPGLLPVRCLNGEGRLIKPADQRWVSLAPVDRYVNLYSSEVTIKETGEMVGKVSESNSGYSALYRRKEILEAGEEKYKESLSKESGNFKLEKHIITNLKEIGSPLYLKYDLMASGSGQSNDVLYLNPMLGQGEKENPFKLEQRTYPVDFGYPKDETYTCRFTIPDGYQIDEAPKNALVSLPGNAGKFTFMVQQQGNVVQVLSKISIMKPVFYAEEYGSLKEFYNLIVSKHAEQIVLKKTNAN